MAKKASGAATDKPKCLTCVNKSQSRGLCGTCLASANASMSRGEVTEQELIDAKMILPRKSIGRPPKSGFSEKLNALKSGKARKAKPAKSR